MITHHDSDRPNFKVTEIETRVTIVSSFISVFNDLTTPKKITYLQYMQKPTNKEDLSPREFMKGRQCVSTKFNDQQSRSPSN